MSITCTPLTRRTARCVSDPAPLRPVAAHARVALGRANMRLTTCLKIKEFGSRAKKLYESHISNTPGIIHCIYATLASVPRVRGAVGRRGAAAGGRAVQLGVQRRSRSAEIAPHAGPAHGPAPTSAPTRAGVSASHAERGPHTAVRWAGFRSCRIAGNCTVFHFSGRGGGRVRTRR